MISVRWPRRGTLLWVLVLVAGASGAAGVGTAWLLSRGGPGSVAGAPSAAAETVFGPGDALLGEAQPYDPAVSFPSTVSALSNPPSHLLVDASGKLWFPLFTSAGGARLWRYDPATDALSSHELPSSPASGLFSAVSAAPDGHVLLAYGYLVVDFDPASGAFKQFQLPQPPANFAKQSAEPGTWVTDMAVDAGGAVYVSRMNTAALTKVEVSSGTIAEIPLPATFGTVMEVAAGKDGIYLSNWLDGPGIARQVALLGPTGTFTSIGGGASGLAVRPDGSVYAATMDRGIAALSSAGVSALAGVDLTANLSGMKDYVVIDQNSGITWFAGRDVGTIGRLDPGSASASIYQLPAYVVPGSRIFCPPPGPCQDVVSRTRVDGLAVAPNGDLYFADATRNRIGLIRGQ